MCRSSGGEGFNKKATREIKIVSTRQIVRHGDLLRDAYANGPMAASRAVTSVTSGGRT